MPKKTNNIVKESNALARATIQPAVKTVWEERIISTIAAKNRINDLEFRGHVLRPEDLTASGEVSTRQFGEIKLAVKRLGSTTYTVPMGKRGIVVYPIFEKIGVDDNGEIFGKFNQGLKEHYLELQKQFALRSLPEFQALTSIYSQILYRYLNSCHNSPIGDWEVSIEDLCTLVDAPPTCRKDFRQFRVNILEVASSEINEKTGLHFDWEPIRPGKRKVTGIRFVFDSGQKAREKQAALDAQRGADELIKRVATECYVNTFHGLKRLCAPKMSGKNAKYCKYCMKSGLFATMWLRKTPDEQTEFLRLAPAMTAAEQADRIKIACEAMTQKKSK